MGEETPQHGSAARPRGARRLVRALAHRNYQLFFVGHGISLVGTWITRVATWWLVHRLTESALLLGLVGFVGQFPMFVIGPFAGVFVDRWPRRRLLVVTQVLAMAQSLLLALVAFLDLPVDVAVGSILVLSLFQGLINAFDMPARQSFVIEMVSREDLANAIALNSSLFNGARLVGPVVAGGLIVWVGEGWCFLIDGLSYVGVIGALMAMRLPRRRETGRPRRPLFEEWAVGWNYVRGFLPIRAILLLLALVSFMGVPYLVLLPIFARDVLGGDARTLGWLVTASGAGSLLAAFVLAARTSVVGLNVVIPLAAALFGAGLILFACSSLLWFSLLMMVVVGFGMITQMASSNTLVQTLVDEDKRGRVMSFYTMANLGTLPLGSLFAGTLAEYAGPSTTLIVGGAACMAAAGLFALRLPAMTAACRPLYIRMGLIPAETDSQASDPARG